MSFKIVDCTIRDGGHINKWHFTDDLVKASYFAASKAQVDYFEIGYKNDPKVNGIGPYGYCNEDYIFSLFKSFTEIKLLCMIDAGKYTGYFIPKCNKEKTPFTGIRIAAYPYEAEIAIKQIESLYEKGYEVFFQLMAWSEWIDKDINILKKWKNKGMLNAVYFADSFGSYIPEDITNHFRKLKSLGFKKIGFHSHNNIQMAFANSLQAIKEGASYIDASTYGLGRGAGNLPIEILLSYLLKQGSSKHNVVPYLDIIDRYYISLQKELGWGYSLKSLLSGITNIHPYYVSEIFKQKIYSVEEIWNALDYIKQNCPISFNQEKLTNALGKRFYLPSSSEATNIINIINNQIKILPSKDSFKLEKISFENRHKNKKFLIIANGPSIKNHQGVIKKYITKEKPITIGCNFLGSLYRPRYHIFVSKKRFLKYINTKNKNNILLVPTFFGREIIKENYCGKYEYLEIKSISDILAKPINSITQQHVYLNVAVAAILTAFQMGAREINVIGIDGYRDKNSKEISYFYNEDGNPEDKIISSVRYEKLAIELKRVADFLQQQGVSFSIITPTTHKKHYKNFFKIKNE